MNEVNIFPWQYYITYLQKLWIIDEENLYEYNVKNCPYHMKGFSFKNFKIVHSYIRQIICWRAGYRQALVNSTFSRPQQNNTFNPLPPPLPPFINPYTFHISARNSNMYTVQLLSRHA